MWVVIYTIYNNLTVDINRGIASNGSLGKFPLNCVNLVLFEVVLFKVPCMQAD